MSTTLNNLDCRGMHNFSYPAINSYFRLDEQDAKGQVELIDDRILVVTTRGRTKSFVYSGDAVPGLQERGPVYSIDDIGLDKKSSFKELCYDLDAVFDPASYANAKKRHQRIVYPFKKLASQNIVIRELLEDDFEACEALHTTWVDAKMKDPKVFRMMFPTARYIKCVRDYLSNPVDYRGLVAEADGQICAVRIVGVADSHAYDLAFFSEFYKLPSQFTGYINIAMLRHFYSTGIKVFNCGAALNKHLHQFKAHYPNFEAVSYAYSRLKKDADEAPAPKPVPKKKPAPVRAERKIGAKAYIRSLLEAEGTWDGDTHIPPAYSARDLQDLLGVEMSTVLTAISDLRSSKYCGTNQQPLSIIKNSTGEYHLESHKTITHGDRAPSDELCRTVRSPSRA